MLIEVVGMPGKPSGNRGLFGEPGMTVFNQLSMLMVAVGVAA